MCNIQDVNFTKNGSTYVPYCSVLTTDNIGAQVVVNLTEAPINAYCMFTFDTPTGRHDYYTNGGNLITMPNNGTVTLNLTNSDGFNVSTAGTYTFVGVDIINDTKTAVLCRGTTAGNCTSVTSSSSSSTYNIQITSGTGGQIQVFINGTDNGYFRGTKTFAVNNGDSISVWCDADTGYTYTSLCINGTSTCTTSRPFNFTANMNIAMTATFSSTTPPPPGGTTPPPPGGTTPPPPGAWTCDPVKCPNNGTNYCISGNCVPGRYILYGAAILFAFLLIKK